VFTDVYAQDWTHDVYLMHHYTAETAQTFSPFPVMVDIFRNIFPKWGIDHPYLMRGLMAITAFHLTYQEPGRRSTWLPLAIKHQTLALTTFRATLAKPSKENHQALFALSLLLSLCSMASSVWDDLSLAPVNVNIGNPSQSLLRADSVSDSGSSPLNEHRAEVDFGSPISYPDASPERKLYLLSQAPDLHVKEHQDLRESIRGVIQPFVLIRGSRDLKKLLGAMFNADAFTELRQAASKKLAKPDVDDPSHQECKRDSYPDQNIAERRHGHLPKALESHMAQLRDAVARNYQDSLEKVAVLLEALTMLEILYRVVIDRSGHGIDPNTRGVAWSWPVTVSKEYEKFLLSHDHGALVIYAHFAVLSTAFRASAWWLDGWPRRVVSIVRKVVGAEWQEWVQWTETEVLNDGNSFTMAADVEEVASSATAR
jgi:hypothetical protein